MSAVQSKISSIRQSMVPCCSIATTLIYLVLSLLCLWCDLPSDKMSTAADTTTTIVSTSTSIYYIFIFHLCVPLMGDRDASIALQHLPYKDWDLAAWFEVLQWGQASDESWNHLLFKKKIIWLDPIHKCLWQWQWNYLFTPNDRICVPVEDVPFEDTFISRKCSVTVD